MKLTYNINDKPKFKDLLAFAFQQLLAIMAATIAVPAIVGNGLTASAALFGAGAGTFVYLLFTKFNSPVFLGSSFAFIGSMFAAFAGGVSMQLGFLGLILGAVFAGLVYVLLAFITKASGVEWIQKLMPAVVIGPTVAIIGLSLAGNAVGDLTKGDCGDSSKYVALICGLVTLTVVIICSVKGSKMVKLIPFIIGIGAGYAVAFIFTLIGKATGNSALEIIDFTPFKSLLVNGHIGLGTFLRFPKFTIATAIGGFRELTAGYVGTIFVAYAPVAFVVFAEHIADHKNLSTIINKDLLKEPGLHRTLLGDGVGSMAGAFFGGCPNTTYGESVACVAITGNASVETIKMTALMAIIIAFISPVVALLDSIPSCVMGGVCMTLYGFIAVSGLKMIQKVDLEDNRNLFTVSVILIAGIGGLSLTFGKVTLTEVACALILGILTNILVRNGKQN
ncbi:MAG: hypothetical protein MJ052_03900 [Sphaerochaetaceae bacterium]|nr:hypothetical protein [Sphaerochaetaceae bacterium]